MVKTSIPLFSKSIEEVTILANDCEFSDYVSTTVIGLLKANEENNK